MKLNFLSIILIFIVSINILGGQNYHDYPDSLYYGKKGFSHIFVTIKSDRAIAEIYLNAKGYIVKPIDDDTLFRDKNEENTFTGKYSKILFRKKGLKFIQISDFEKFKFQNHFLNNSIDYTNQLNKYKNYSYLYIKRDESYKIIKETVNSNDISKAYQFYYTGINKYGIDSLVKVMPNNEFKIKCTKIVDTTLEEIIKRYQ